MPQPAIILDCDPGHDDALAILLAAKHCEILGITTVSGNAPLRATTRNALIITQIAGLELPVYAGAERPLVAEAQHAPDIHGESGLGGPVLPPLTREVAGTDAVRFIIDTVREHEGVWLVAVGPLTNVALALREAPDLAARVAGISVMGGSASFGNRTPTAEFNIWADPEAAQVVFSSGARVIMCGLNLTHQYMLYDEDVAQIQALGNPAANLAADLLGFYSQAYAEAFFGHNESPLHDPCAVLAVTHPDLIRTEPRHVEVELRGEHTRGMTVVDERGRLARDNKPPNVQVAYSIERDDAVRVLLETLSSYS